MKNKLIIVISGQICRENSANLLNFWNGFINIQKSIYDIDDLNIVAHSWNPEHNELVNNVYKPKILASDKQESFFIDYISNVETIDMFEKDLDRSNSKWKKISYQTLFGNATSRSKAIELLENNNFEEFEQVLVTRWDQGCTGSKNVNNINFDSSLNKEYIYLSYYPEIDEGYADMWFVSSFEDALLFKDYDKYLKDCLAGRNEYINKFTSSWPLSLKRKKEKFRKEKFIFSLIKKLNKIKIPFFSKKLIKYELKLLNKIEMPIKTGENYLKNDFKSDVKFPVYQALNNHAILKSFFLDNNLRNKTRFLEINDFENNIKGQVINPISFAYVIYSHSSFSDCWEMAVSQAIECLPTNCNKIYLLSEKSEYTTENYERIIKNSYDIELLTYDDNINYTKRLKSAFDIIKKHSKFIYFVHEDMPLVGKVDNIYLNSLLHYMNNSNEFYIKLVDTTLVNKKEEHESFPFLNKNFGGYSISVQPSIFKVDYLISLMDNIDDNIYGFERLCTNSNMIFSAVKGNRKIGKYLISNEKFPHIATAIAKGKWCTSEWGDEIRYIATKYNIDLSIRGEK